MSFEPPPRNATGTDKPMPPALPQLEDKLSERQRTSCLALAYCALQLTLQAKKKMDPDQRARFRECVQDVIEVGCVAFPLAVAIWLRNKKELGNRLISTNLLAVCAHCEATRPFVRQTAALVLKLPTDLTEFMAEFDTITADGIAVDKSVKRPACMKKIAKDILESMPPFQAAKYDSRTKIQRTRSQLNAVKKSLKDLGISVDGTTTLDGDKGNLGKGNPVGGGNPFGKGSFRNATSKEANVKNLQKRYNELVAKLDKLRAGDLSSLIRFSHPEKPHHMIMGILRKRYPETEEDFKESGLDGDFDCERMGTRLRLEVPLTWDRELSDKGNVPATWAALLKAKNDKGHFTLPYMALLRNLRNILLMGFSPGFLRTNVITRLTDLKQIQGSGQTPVSLSHTWSVLQKEFEPEKLTEMQEQASSGLRDILAYKLLLRKIKGPILGYSDKQVGIIGEFLGEPVWAPCGLKRQNDCFLALNRIVLRGGMVLEQPKKIGKGAGKGKGKGKSKDGGKGPKEEKWLPVACNPVSEELLSELQVAFDKAIQVAAICATDPICFEGEGPVVCWMDLSNPPLATVGDSKKQETSKAEASASSDAPSPASPMAYMGGYSDAYMGRGRCKPDPSVDLAMAGLKVTKDCVTMTPGQEVELDEISTHRMLCLELRYFCGSYIDYNVMAYDASGSHLWNSTYSNPEVKNKAGEKCCVHCRDICSNPSPTEPAVRTLHIDLDALDENILALMITSQIFSGVRPEAVSVALRECHNGGCKVLHGNHNTFDFSGRLLLAADISEPLKAGGTTVYACLYRDPSDPQSFLFRNTLDLSLDSESRVACQIEKATGAIFRQMFRESALASTMDASRVGYVRLCQFYQAAKAASKPTKFGGKGTPVDVRVFLSGIKKRAKDPEVVELTLTGEYVKDLEAVRACKRQFCGKAVDANISLSLVLKAAGGKPAGIVRVANNSHMPTAELASLRESSGCVIPYATIDARGHIFDAFRELPEIEKTVSVPGQVESCVTILRNILVQMSSTSEPVPGAELIVRYIDSFLPRVTGEATRTGAGEGEEAA
jgi:hypothetical protein